MKKKELLQRIEALEARVARLESYGIPIITYDKTIPPPPYVVWSSPNTTGTTLPHSVTIW